MSGTSDLLAQLLQAVLIVALPILTKYLTDFTRAKAAEAHQNREISQAENYLWLASEAVNVAVDLTSQTYVNGLKASGSWDGANWKTNAATAKQIALDAAKASLTADAKEFLATVYGDLDGYLSTLIEAAVLHSK